MARFRFFFSSALTLLGLTVIVLSLVMEGFISSHPAIAAPVVKQNTLSAGSIHIAETNQTARFDAQASSSKPVTYHNGYVMRQTSTTYAIFWEPPTLPDGSTAYVSPAYNTLISRYFGDVGGSSLYNNNTQYYDNFSGHIVNSSTFGGFWTDVTRPYPNPSDCTDSVTPSDCLINLDIQSEVRRALKANPTWTAGLNSIFFVFTAKGEGSCTTKSSTQCAFGGGTQKPYCAYHNAFNLTKTGPVVLYTNMPYDDTLSSKCGIQPYTSKSPNNDFDADSEINLTSHEQMETVTDPLTPEPTSGWYDSNKNEIGDKCAFQFGPSKSKYNGGDVQWNGHNYFVQQEWSNYSYTLFGKGCTLSETSPLLDGTIYTSDGNSTLAFNTSDGTDNGSPRWQGSCTSCSFYPPVASSGIVYYLNGDGSLLAVNETTGLSIGTFPDDTGYPPIVHSSDVYISGTDGSVYAFNADGTQTIWKTPVGNLISPPILSNGVLYVREAVTETSENLYALKVTSGKILWHHSLPNGFYITSNQAVSNGVFYFVTSSNAESPDETVYAFSLSTKQVLWQYYIGNGYAVNANLTVANGAIYFGVSNINAGYIYSLSVKDGSELWPPYATGSPAQQPTEINGVVYDGADGVYALSASTGSLIWHKPTGSSPASSPTVIDGVIFVNGIYLYALNVQNGSIRWQAPLQYPSSTQPAISLVGY